MSAQLNHHREKTTGQVKSIFGEGRKCGLDAEGIRDVVEDITKGRTRSIRKLSYTEAERIIERLKGKSFVPRRTMQYRRARQGVKQVVQASQLTLIAELATQRSWSAESLVKFCKRQCGHHPLRTTEDANKVIEALKSMNKRDKFWAGDSGAEAVGSRQGKAGAFPAPAPAVLPLSAFRARGGAQGDPATGLS